MPALVISAAAMSWVWYATGPGLGLFLGAVLLLTLYTPAIILAEERRGRWIAATSILLGTALVLALSARSIDVTPSELLRCCCVLAAYVWVLGGVTGALNATRFPAPIAAGITVLLALLWLTWPVWLSPWLTQTMADWLTPANPLLAINGIVKHLGTWDRAPLAYRSLTVLNQDVPYHLPTSILPAVLLHLLIGTPGMIFLARRSCVAPIPPPAPAPT